MSSNGGRAGAPRRQDEKRRRRCPGGRRRCASTPAASTCRPTKPSRSCCRAAARWARIRPVSIKGLDEAGIRAQLDRRHFDRRAQYGDHRGQCARRPCRRVARILGDDLPAGVRARRCPDSSSRRSSSSTRRGFARPSRRCRPFDAIVEGQKAFSCRAFRRRRRWPIARAPQRGKLLRHRAAQGDARTARAISSGSIDGEMRVSVGAVNVRTGNFAYFDNTRMHTAPRALHGVGRVAAGVCRGRDRRRVLLGRRPGVEHAARRGPQMATPRRDTLVFQVDLWSARRAGAATASST